MCVFLLKPHQRKQNKEVHEVFNQRVPQGFPASV